MLLDSLLRNDLDETAVVPDVCAQWLSVAMAQRFAKAAADLERYSDAPFKAATIIAELQSKAATWKKWFGEEAPEEVNRKTSRLVLLHALIRVPSNPPFDVVDTHTDRYPLVPHTSARCQERCPSFLASAIPTENDD